MTILGIIGGIAPESTVEYYRAIVRMHQERGGGYPPILINSIDLTKMIGFITDGRLPELVAYLSGELQRLAAAGADVALFASNTPHLVFEELRAQSPIPLISIVESAAEVVAAIGSRRVALFGTRFTMQGSFYAREFAKHSIEVIAPAPDDLDEIHTRYMGELVLGDFRDSTRERLFAIIDRMKSEHDIDGVVLAGTELPLLLRTDTRSGIRLFDTGRIHAEAAVDRLRS